MIAVLQIIVSYHYEAILFSFLSTDIDQQLLAVIFAIFKLSLLIDVIYVIFNLHILRRMCFSAHLVLKICTKFSQTVFLNCLNLILIAPIKQVLLTVTELLYAACKLSLVVLCSILEFLVL